MVVARRRLRQQLVVIGLTGIVAFVLAVMTGLSGRSREAAAQPDDSSAALSPADVMHYLSDGLFIVAIGAGLALFLIAVLCDFATPPRPHGARRTPQAAVTAASLPPNGVDVATDGRSEPDHHSDGSATQALDTRSQ
jgi:hypothetical protein